jgi:hypothetical protein
LFSQAVVAIGDNLNRRGDIIENLHTLHKPGNEEERNLLFVAADSQYRIELATSYQDGSMANEHAGPAGDFDTVNEQVHAVIAQGRAFENQQKTLNNAALYVSRFFRTQQAAMKQFRELQKARLAREAEEMERAILYAKYMKMKKQAFVPAEHGFEFSAQQVDAEIARRELWEAVQLAEKCNFNAKVFARRAEVELGKREKPADDPENKAA